MVLGVRICCQTTGYEGVIVSVSTGGTSAELSRNRGGIPAILGVGSPLGHVVGHSFMRRLCKSYKIHVNAPNRFTWYTNW